MKPFPYQVECIEQTAKLNGRVLLSLDMGLGKTAISLWCLQADPVEMLPALVICPAAVKLQWKAEAMRVLGIRASVLEHRAPKMLPRMLYSPKLVVINYDILQSWSPFLKSIGFRTIILDEIQYTANLTKRTKACLSLCQNIPHVIGLSGTPLLNRPIELFYGLSMISPKIFKSRWAFGQRYCGPRRTPWGWEFKGATNTAELHKLLSTTCMIRRRKTEVMSQLPPKVRRVVTLPLSDPTEYHRARVDFLNWLKQEDPTKAERAAKAQALVKIGYLLRLSAKLKLKYAVDWINEFLENSDEKLVVFAVHTKCIDALQRRCMYKSVVIDGSVTGKDRNAAVNLFRNDNSVRLLIGNIRAAGVGVDGLQIASNAAFVELPWQPGAALQAEDRIHRIGTRSKAWIWYLVAHNTVESRLCNILQRKQNMLSSVLDGGKVAGDLDIFDKLMKEIGTEFDS